MDLTLSPAEERFRDTLRAWIADNHPGKEPEGDEASFAFRRDWQRALNEQGWAGLTWPTEYGGSGATQIEQAILFEEFARARAPQMANGCPPNSLASGSRSSVATKFTCACRDQ